MGLTFDAPRAGGLKRRARLISKRRRIHLYRYIFFNLFKATVVDMLGEKVEFLET